MCGIVGTINKPFDNSVLDLIKHRGPDDGEILDLNISDSKITLGHRRLSIQDLSAAGHQPMYSYCGKFVIIFNGEIYNHLDLRKKLTDIEFKGHSDTETIVNYIAKFGIESIKDLNGIFGFSLLDVENNKLYVARDRYGVKPIYFCVKDDEFIFCLLYTSPSPRDRQKSRMPSSA
jgi:asparagine synthase (glutamine-hydrolysing)